MDHSLIKYLPPRIEECSIVWQGEMRCPQREREEVYFKFTCPDPDSFVPFIRPFLLAFLIPAMRVGLPIQLEQPLDLITLHNLMEWQEAVAGWFPDKLTVVPIKCDIAPSPFPAGPDRATSLTAFSGGVDSCYTALYHSPTQPAGIRRHTDLGAGLMIHGFDIPESQPDTFDSAFNRSRNILDSLRLDAYGLKTNLRNLEGVFGCDWEHETHGIWLAAALACLEPFFDRTLIPASYPYHRPVLPWASNPMTDHLFASDKNDLWHDGAALDKLDKVKAIAPHPAIQKNLRVCWEGAKMDRNCGQCSKCVMTQLCFWVSGVRNPPCFDVPCSNTLVETLKQDSYYSHLTEQIRKEARRQGMTQLDRQLGRAVRRTQWKNVSKLIRHPGTILKAYD